MAVIPALIYLQPVTAEGSGVAPVVNFTYAARSRRIYDHSPDLSGERTHQLEIWFSLEMVPASAMSNGNTYTMQQLGSYGRCV